MRFRSVYFIALLSVIALIPLDAQNSGVIKFDPFLQRELKQHEHIELLREAEPGIPSPALSKIQLEDEPLYNVIFHGDNQALDDLGIRFNTRIDGLATARVTLHDLLRAGHHPGIRQVEKGGEMTVNLNQSIRSIRVNRVHDGEILNIPFRGRDVIIGLIDTGIDFFHPDFRGEIDPDISRILSIWDVRLDPQGGEQHPDNFDYGVEYTRDDIQRELRGETQGNVRSVDPHGHGTHVAGIAGGNGMKSDGKFTGVAPEAEFIIVAFPDGRFFPAEIMDAMNYIFSMAHQLGRPAVVNLSIGGHGGSHDGTAGHEQAITFFSRQQGRAIAVAAGNSGDNEIHYGQILPSGEEAAFNLHIPDYNPDLVEMDDFVLKLLWYEGDGDVEVTVTSPSGQEVSAQSGDSVLVPTLDGAIELDTLDDFINPKGARVFLIYIHTNAGVPPASGEWGINVRNLSGVSEVKFNSWIVSQSMNWPWLQPNTGRQYTVTMPGTAEGALTVGSFVSKTEWIDINGTMRGVVGTIGDLSFFSGGGPTRDERLKPNITAPGHVITSATSGNAAYQDAWLVQDQEYVNNVGTSMAVPHMAGVAALIFEANPNVTGRDVIDIIEKSGRSDDLTGSVPNNTWGFGKADAIAMFDHFEVTHGIPEDFFLYQNFPNPFNAVTTIRFTIPEPTRGKLAIYDILGRKVDVVIEGDFEPRVYTVTFDGSRLSSGVYFYRLQTDAFTNVQKMILLR